MIKRQRNRHAEIKDSLTLTPRESVKLTRFGLNHTYELLRTGEMPSIKLGKRFFIPKSALLKWLESAALPTKSAESARLAG
jgi:excisionase family DNA binding protein